jgi:hypothetical protein
MDCSKITQGLQAVNCGKPAIPGTGQKVILINYSDIDRALSTAENNVISNIELKGDSHAYAFESLENANLGEASYNKGTYFGNWQHDLTARIFAKNESAKKFVNNLNGARIVAIVENKEDGPEGQVKYEAYGWDAGLELNEGTASTDMADLVVYQIKLGSGTNSKEISLPKSVFVTSEVEGTTDLQATETMLDALIAA